MTEVAGQTKVCSACGEVKPIADYYVANNGRGPVARCKPCTGLMQLAYRRNNHEKVKQGARAWAAKNMPRAADKLRIRKYGTDGREQFAAQGGKCAICGTELITDTPRSAHIEAKLGVLDHCHESGVVRGWLCALCNVALGRFKDSPELLRKAADYLERFEVFK